MANEQDPSRIHVGPEKRNWLPWILLGLGLLALLFALSRCGRDEAAVTTAATTTTTTTTTAPAAVGTAAPAAVAATAGASVGGLGAYLAGSEAAPRTFVFDNLNFDTASAAIRPADAATVAGVANVLKQYPTTRVRVVGFADARGSGGANAQLGQARAEAVKAALVRAGIDAGRVETGTAGEDAPIDTNATTPGQAHNRRTELVVTSR